MVKTKLFFITLIGVIFFSFFVNAELNLSDSLTNQRYQIILNEFNQTDFVSIIVEVYSPEKIDNLISSFSETDFKDVKKELSPNIFTVKVTKKGLGELTSNPNIKGINLEEPLSPAENLTINYNGLYWLIGIILILIIFWGIGRIKKKK